MRLALKSGDIAGIGSVIHSSGDWVVDMAASEAGSSEVLLLDNSTILLLQDISHFGESQPLFQKKSMPFVHHIVTCP